ncbi:aromatic-l-amino-acid decarboxylase [Niveomyces insectorum RCEF 264]|uniref:Aromatic-l-amino-acid decarboxylase n=1 Tax=Niveomyces insectorum RCEF 264 TaxID=1081102 RepID=A0A167WWK6_9HYPO|nr:aromatic-l-amino-acid decarboxylase [Niveomyces insectorum RCEF 264]
MDDNAFREAATASIEEIIQYYASLGSRPVVSTVQPGYLRKLLPETAPETGEPWAAIQADVEAKIVPGLTHWQSPNFFAFFPCPSSYPSILGELYSATFAAAAFNWVCSPAITELETVVLDWVARLMALPDAYLSTGPTHGGGVIHGTASEAVLTMMAAAADKYLRARAALCPAPADPADYGTGVLRRCHSFNVNLHKWLLTNFDCSCVFVRDRAWLLAALGNGEQFAAALAARPDLFEIVTGPRFALTVFRCAPQAADEDPATTTARTRRVYEAVNSGGKIWATGTELEGKGFTIRVMTANYATQAEHVAAAADIYVAATERVLQEEKATATA